MESEKFLLWKQWLEDVKHKVIWLLMNGVNRIRFQSMPIITGVERFLIQWQMIKLPVLQKLPIWWKYLRITVKMLMDWLLITDTALWQFIMKMKRYLLLYLFRWKYYILYAEVNIKIHGEIVIHFQSWIMSIVQVSFVFYIITN